MIPTVRIFLALVAVAVAGRTAEADAPAAAELPLPTQAPFVVQALPPPGPPPVAVGKAGDGIEVRVLVVTENRNNNGSGAVGLGITLSGTGLARDTVVRQVRVTRAVDDAGRSLMAPPGRAGASPGISPQSINSKLAAILRGVESANMPVPVGLGGAARDAKSIAVVEGEIEIYSPSEDDGSMVILRGVRARAGKPLADEALAKNGVEFVILTPDTLREYLTRAGLASEPAASTPVIRVYVRDPQAKLVGFVFRDEDGQPAVSGGGSGAPRGNVLNIPFPRGVPEELQLAFFFVTPASLLRVPFRIEDIPLP